MTISAFSAWLDAAAIVIRHFGIRQWKNWIKFLLRSLLAPRAMLRFCDFVRADAELRKWAISDPSMFFKPQRPYLYAGLGVAGRVDRFIEHYRFFRSRLPLAVQRQLFMRRSMVLATVADPDVGCVVVKLERRERFAKEGEIVIGMYAGGGTRCLCSIAFNFAGAPDRRLIVGCIQGAGYKDALADIRLATKNLEGLRPASFVFETLRRLGWILGCDRVEGVGRRQHIYKRSLLKRSAVSFDYDQFWQQYGATRNNGLYALDNRPHRIDLARYPSKKRAMVRRRQALLDGIERQIALRLALPASSQIEHLRSALDEREGMPQYGRVLPEASGAV
jgi:uncharacterized protein VirK/YbjX